MENSTPAIELLFEFFHKLETDGFLSPDFSNSKEIIIFSDYAGERKEDKYYSYSFYITDRDSTLNAVFDLLDLRKNEPEWKETSFIEYKKLKKDKVRRRILPEFLNLFDNYKGLIVTVLIEKTSPNYFMKVSGKEAEHLNNLGLGSWKPEILRKLSNILTIVAFLVKRFLDKNKDFYWYSDRDDIFGANQSKGDKTLNMFSLFLKTFKAEIKEKRFRFVSDKHRVPDSDFLSLTDLSAGAILDHYQKSQKGGELKGWTKQITKWMFSNDSNLKKVVLLGGEEGNQKILTPITIP